MTALAKRCDPRNIGGTLGVCLWCGVTEGQRCPMMDPGPDVVEARARLATVGYPLALEAEPSLAGLRSEARLWP